MIHFSDDRFPIDISLGAIGGPEYKTEVITSINGIECINIKWSQSRMKYNISYGLKTKEQIEKLLSFFRTKKGKAIGFRFKDWTDFYVEKSKIGIGDGISKKFQLSKKYESGNYIENRTITKPVLNTVKIFLKNQIISSEKYKVDYNKGIIEFYSSIPEGLSIDSSFEFDVPVRFDTDHLPISIEDIGLYSCHNISLIEIKELLNPSQYFQPQQSNSSPNQDMHKTHN